MIDTDKYEGHTPADQWTTYKMGADKPYHAVRIGQRGLDLELKFGADAQLIADAPLLKEEVLRLREKNRHLQDLLVKARGDCWECGMPLDSCDSHNCERQRQEDMDLMMEESE